MKLNKYITSAALAALVAVSSNVNAAKGEPLLDRKQLSFGGGLSLNSVGSNDEVGYQFFGVYHLDQFNLMEYVDTSVEFGYMDYGDFGSTNSGGLWVNAVIDGAIQNNIGWLARAGLDLGDDDGLMIGGGAAYYIDNSKTLRFEYVIRDNVDSLQVNFIQRL